MFDASKSDSWWNGMVGDGFREDTSGAAIAAALFLTQILSVRLSARGVV